MSHLNMSYIIISISNPYSFNELYIWIYYLQYNFGVISTGNSGLVMSLAKICWSRQFCNILNRNDEFPSLLLHKILDFNQNYADVYWKIFF